MKNENVQLEPGDLSLITSINNKLKQHITVLGEIRYQVIDTNQRLSELEKSEKNLTTTINGIIEEQTKVLEVFREKYGEGVLNLETGTIAKSL